MAWFLVLHWAGAQDQEVWLRGRRWVSSWGWQCSVEGVILFHHFVSTMNIHSPLISLEFQTLSFFQLHFPALPSLAPSPETCVTEASHQHAWFSSFWWDVYNCNPVALPPLFWACATSPVMLAEFLVYFLIFSMVLRTNLLTIIEMSVQRPF